MRLVTSGLNKLISSARPILLVALSCAVLAAALLIALNEFNLLRPSAAEEMILRWDGGAAAAAE